MKRLLIVVFTSLLFGCGTDPVSGNTQIVQVPVAVKCEPTVKVTEIEEYPFDKAKKEMTLYEKFQLAYSELLLVKGQNVELKAALKECTK